MNNRYTSLELDVIELKKSSNLDKYKIGFYLWKL